MLWQGKNKKDILVKRISIGLVVILLIAMGSSVLAQQMLGENQPSKSVTFLNEDIKNVSNLERLGVPYMVRRNIPGTADAIIYNFDYDETKALVPGVFDVSHYFKYDEIKYWLDKWNRQYPGITEIISIGKTMEGRDIYVLAITNKKTGHRVKKPAMWMGGARHSGEQTATVAVMDFINQMLTGYGNDEEMTYLVDNFTYYMQPSENPDGNMLYLSTVHSLRSTLRPYDSNNNNIADEDIENDLDNDGLILQIRKYVGPGKGNRIKDPNDPSGRLMLNVKDGEGDYMIYPEGIDVDGDGVINSDTIGGLDLHRQDSNAWRPMTEDTGWGYTQNGGSQAPYSEPEIRSLFQFFVANPNISIANTMHTAVPQILRGPSSSATSESVYSYDQKYFYDFDEKGMNMTGYPWAGDTHEIYMSRSATGIDPKKADKIILRQQDILGHGLDWGYFEYGAFFYGDELWGNMRHEYLEDWLGLGKIEERGLNALYAKDNVAGFEKIFKDWKRFYHPDLGAVEIGGFNPKFWNTNPPPHLLEKVVRRQTNWNMELAKSLPLLDITGVKVADNGDGTKTVTATIENKGITPDATKQAYLIKMVKINDATIKLGEGLTLVPGEETLFETKIPIYGTAYVKNETNTQSQNLSYFAGTLFEDDLDDRFYSKDRGGPGPWQRVQEVSWIVKGSGTAEIEVRSTRGGWPTTTLEVKK